jgi:phospholipid/cholesterol/gamma-HCH transport system substrate-binding protein
MRKYLVSALVAVLGVGVGVYWLSGSDSYRVQVVLGSATNLVIGGTVEVRGFKAGEVSGLSVKDGKALVTVSLDHSYAPLHDGAKLNVDWKSLLGERIINITDGANSNATIPDGGMIAGTQADPVELDAVLEALDPTTRAHLSSLVKSLNTTFTGSTADLNATLVSAGPALQALGDVLRALGTDGPAISDLVSRLNTMVSTVSAHDGVIVDVLDELKKITTAAASQHESLSSALKELPTTLQDATNTFGELPGVVAKADPLLKKLQPVAAQLPSVAANLEPVLRSLQPVAAKLRSTLLAASHLLQYTPGLLDAAGSTLPGIEATASYLEPVLGFLRPYTPEIAGFLTTWASAFSNYNANGHYMRAFVQAGLTAVDVNPGIVPPGDVNQPYPAPGANVGQPWTDAFGSGVH